MRRTHGDTRKARLYRTWANMKFRCSCSPKHGRIYQKYAGRGVSVCQQWHRYETFRDWALANGYRDDLTIDRVDAAGNYEPDNCRWVTIQFNSSHTSRTAKGRAAAEMVGA